MSGTKTEPRVFKKASVDEASGTAVGFETRMSAKGAYDVLTLADINGESHEIAMPASFRLSFDLVEGGEYSARWANGKLMLVQGIVDLTVEAVEDGDF